MAVEQEMSPIDKYVRGLISQEEYVALISGETANEEDPSTFEVLNKTVQELAANSWAGVRALGEAFDNQDLIERANEGIAYREQVSAKFGRPMMVEDIKDFEDIPDYIFTSAVPQILPSLALSLPSAYAGFKTGAAIGAIGGPVGAGVGGAIGLGLGAFLPSALLNIGEIDREIKQRAGEDVESGLTSIGYGSAAAALDVVSLAIGLKAVLPRIFKNSPVYKEGLDNIVDSLVSKGVPNVVASRAVSNAAIAAAAEGTTEMAQEVIIDFAAEQKTGVSSSQEEFESNLLNSFTLGALGGLPVGAASGYMRGREIQKDVDSKRIRDEKEAQIKEEVEQFVINNDLENLDGESLAAFAVDNYSNFRGGIEPIPIDLTADTKEVLNQIKALEFQRRFGRETQKLAETATLPELQKEDLIRQELYLLESEDNNSIRTKALELNLNLDNYGDIESLKRGIAKQIVEAKFMQSPVSKFLSRPKEFEESVLELSQLSRGELEYKAKELLPNIYGRPGEAFDIETDNDTLISEIAEKEFYLKRSKELLKPDDDEPMVLIIKPENQTKTYENEIRPGDPARGNVIEFGIEQNGQNYIFKKEPVFSGKDIIDYDYIEQGSGESFSDFEVANAAEIDNRRITSITVRKGDYPQFKPDILNKIKSSFEWAFASTKGYTTAFFEEDRNRRARMKAINSSFQFFVKEYQEAKNAAIRNGTLTDEQEVNRISNEYLTNRYERKILDEDDPIRNIIQRKISELEEQALRANPGSSREAFLKKQIAALREDLRSGIRTSVTTLVDLPVELRAPLIGMRSGIDRLVQRLLDEMPNEVLDQLKKVRKVDETTGELTIEEEPARDILQATMGSYITEQYKLFEEGTGWNPRSIWNRIAPSDKVRRIYDDAVAKVLQMNPELNEAQAKKQVNDIVNQSLSDGQVSGKILGSMYKIDPEQETISPIEKYLSQKQALPKEFKALFGEFEDPSQVGLNTASKLITFVENYRFYNKLKELNEKTGERIFTTTRAEEYNTVVPLKDTPLDGLYTTKEMAEAMKIVQQDKSFFEKWVYGPLVLVPKFLAQSFQTVYSAMAQARNFATAGMFYGVRNGNLWKDFPAGARGVWTDLGGSYDSNGNATRNMAKAQKFRDFMEAEGIINTEVRTGEIISSFEEAMSGGYRNIAEFTAWLMTNSGNGGGFTQKTGVKPLSFIKKAIGYPQKLYTAADDFWKTAAFFGERRKLLRNYNNTEDGRRSLYEHSKRLGVKLTEGLDYDTNVNKTAAYIVRNTIPNYDYIGNFVDALRRKLPFAPFVAFPTEIVRTAANHLRIGSVEATSNNFGTRVQGLRSITSLGLATYGVGAAAQALGKALNNLDDEDVEQLRKLVPYFSENSLIIPINIEDGKAEYIDGSHFLVYDTISRMSQNVLNSVADGKEINEEMYKSLAKGFSGAIVEFIGPYASLSIFPEITKNLLVDAERDKIANPALLEQGRWDEYVGLLLGYALSTAQPAFFRQLNDVKKGLTPDEFSFNKYSNRKDFDDAMMALAGVKISEVDVAKTMPFIINNAKREMNTSNDLFEDLIVKGGSVPEEQLIKEYYAAQKGNFLAQQKLYIKYLSALSIASINNKQYRKFKRDLDEQLEDRLGSKVARRIIKGEFSPYKYRSTAEETFDLNTERMEDEGMIPSEGRSFPRRDLDRIYRDYDRADIYLLDNVTDSFPDLEILE